MREALRADWTIAKNALERPHVSTNQTLRTGGYLLFREINLSTIGANGLNFRVRNENGCCPVAEPPDRNVRYKLHVWYNKYTTNQCDPRALCARASTN